MFQAANVQQTLKDIKASNQQAQFLGNKVEVAITNAVEKNKTLLRVGLHFEFGDCRSVSKHSEFSDVVWILFRCEFYWFGK